MKKETGFLTFKVNSTGRSEISQPMPKRPYCDCVCCRPLAKSRGCVLFRFFSHLWYFACLATRGHSLWAELDVIMLGCPSQNRAGWKARFRLSNLSFSGILYEFIGQASTVELKQSTLQGRHRWNVHTFSSNILWLGSRTKSCTSAPPTSRAYTCWNRGSEQEVGSPFSAPEYTS